jgi:hypothetical protein
MAAAHVIYYLRDKGEISGRLAPMIKKTVVTFGDI